MAFKIKKMRKLFLIAFILFTLMFYPISAYASSSYVLPYPSTMPGSLFYRPRLLLEVLQKYWYFGNFGQFKYNLKESDKYLVEAKTLYEYNQFLHASTISLKKSDEYFEGTLSFLIKAQNEGKDILQNRKILAEASTKHIEVLKKLLNELPQEFEWKAEKEKPIFIHISKEIEKSISIREKYL